MLLKSALFPLRGVVLAILSAVLMAGPNLACQENAEPLDDDDDTVVEDEDEGVGGQIYTILDHDFGCVDLGDPATVDIEVRNSGIQPLQLDAATVTGCELGVFDVTTNVPVQIPPNTLNIYALLRVTFIPPEVGDYQAQLELFSSDYRQEDNEPFAIPLYGIGIADLDFDTFPGADDCPETVSDCDDSDPAIYPGAEEVCNGLDDDCSGSPNADEVDNDQDGYLVCQGDCNDSDAGWNLDDLDEDGYTTCDGDCDDGDADVHPDHVEAADTIDNDCDGVIDEGTGAYDDDGDGSCEGVDLYGNGPECTDGTVPGDCDDADAALNLLDLDTDGYTTCDQPADCDDVDPARWPGNPETCDGIDNNCDGQPANVEYDMDADGYMECQGDCDDSDPAMHPDDNDGDGDSPCDGDCDDNDAAMNLQDNDLDGYSTCTGDCDDTSVETNPGMIEQCDGDDNDCDGVVGADELDGDGDGVPPCGGDCDDSNPQMSPALNEVCGDGLDNDCDGDHNGCLLEGTITLDESYARYLGEDDDDLSGNAVSWAGDNDGDGLDDVLIGAFHDNSAFNMGGAAYLVVSTSAGDHDLANAEAKFTGEIESGFAGHAVSTAGDTDGDGFDDLLIGAYWASIGAAMTGAAYLVQGPSTGTLDLASADARFIGDPYTLFGYSLDLAGDTNADGYDDVLIGTQGNQAYLFAGPFSGDVFTGDALAAFAGEETSDAAGREVAFAGDMNADGHADLAIGADSESSAADFAGAVYVVHGPVSGSFSLANADAKLTGEGEWDQAGSALSGGFDLDADGFDDLVVGAYGNDEGGDNAGAAYLLLGPVSGVMSLASADAKLLGETIDEGIGSDVTMAGDMDGDGLGDFLVASCSSDVGGLDAGASYLFYGAVNGTTAISTANAIFLGEAPGDFAGRTSYAGDVNGDGFDDILIGASYEDSAGDNAGATYLLLGGSI